jgi:hypothetical protein
MLCPLDCEAQRRIYSVQLHQRTKFLRSTTVPKPASPLRTAASASEGSGSSGLLAIAVGCCIFTNASIRFVCTPASRADAPKRGAYAGGAASHERPSALVCRTRAIPGPLASESTTRLIWWKISSTDKCKRQKVDLALRSWSGDAPCVTGQMRTTRGTSGRGRDGTACDRRQPPNARQRREMTHGAYVSGVRTGQVCAV